MASRKEERERLRQARLEREQEQASEQRRKLMIGYLVAGVLGLVVIVGIVIAVSSGAAERERRRPHRRIGRLDQRRLARRPRRDEAACRRR